MALLSIFSFQPRRLKQMKSCLHTALSSASVKRIHVPIASRYKWSDSDCDLNSAVLHLTSVIISSITNWNCSNVCALIYVSHARVPSNTTSSFFSFLFSPLSVLILFALCLSPVVLVHCSSSISSGFLLTVECKAVLNQHQCNSRH